jgi:uncharacterized protein YecE (DUF72 family)
MYDGEEDGRIDPQLASERRKPKVPLQPMMTADTCLVRYISHPDLTFNEPYLIEWVPRLAAWLAAGKTVYLFVHCPDESKSPAIARHFYESLKIAYPALSALPWDSVEQPASQLSLF